MDIKTVYDTILVPVDGSDTADRAVEHAGQLAEQHGSSIELLHVVEPIDAAAPTAAGAQMTPELLDTFREQGEELVSETADELPSSVAAETDVAVGPPADTIQEEADDRDADLIAMGTHGRTGVQRVLLGSTTERTLRLADQPVLAISPTPAE